MKLVVLLLGTKKIKRYGTRFFKVPVVPSTRSTRFLTCTALWSPQRRKRRWNHGTYFKNGIYSLRRMMFVKVWMNESKADNYTSIKSQYGLVSVNIKPQKSIKIWILHVLWELRVTSRAFYHLIWVKPASYHIYTQKCKGIHGNPSK